jgi:aminopeptidase N/puromycin-sensitive aminopeptidase
MHAGKSTAGDFLSLATRLKDDNSAAVTESVIGGIHTMWFRVAATPTERKELSDWVVATYGPRLQSMGEPKPGETPDQQELRADLFALVGGIGQDPKVIAESKRIAEAYLANPASVNGTLAHAAVNVAATHGDASFFDLLQKTAETSKDPIIASGALYDLARFKNPELMRRALDYAASGKVRNQDAVALFAIALQSPNTQDSAWQYIEQNWPKVKAQFTTWAGGELVSSTAAFCTTEKQAQVKNFFTTHKVEASESALMRSQNAINDCVDLRADQSANLQHWLSSKTTGM